MKGGSREEGGSWGCACGRVWGRGGAGACCPSWRVGGSLFFSFWMQRHYRFSGALPHAARPLLLPGPPAPRARARRPALPPPRLARLGVTGYRCARPRPGGVPIGVARDQSNTHTPPHTKHARCLPPLSLPSSHLLLLPCLTPPSRPRPRTGRASGRGGLPAGGEPVGQGRQLGARAARPNTEKKSWGLYAGECREGATRARQACHRPPARPGTWGYRWATPWPWKLGVAGALMAAARRRGGSRLFLDTPAPVCRVPACGLPRALSLCILTFFPLPPPSPGRATSGPRRPAPADGCPRRWWWRHGRGGELAAGVWPSDWEGAETLRVGGDAHTPLCLRPRPPGRRRRRRRRQ